MAIIKDPNGFDLDMETVRLLDAVITNIAGDDEVKEEFKKLNFIKALGDKYDDTPGPIEQLLAKVAKIEQNKYKESEDLYRLIGDVQHLANIVEKQFPHAIITGTEPCTALARTRQDKFHILKDNNNNGI